MAGLWLAEQRFVGWSPRAGPTRTDRIVTDWNVAVRTTGFLGAARDGPQAGRRLDGSAAKVNMTKTGRLDETTIDAPTPRTTPPDWDPLGVAPFAWDLPEPTPLPARPQL